MYQIYKQIAFPESLTRVESSNDGKWLAATSYDMKLRIFDIAADFKLVKTVHLGTRFPSLLSFNADATKIVAGGKNATVFDMSPSPKDGTPLCAKGAKFKFKEDPNDSVLDPDGVHIWVVNGWPVLPPDNCVRKFDMTTGEVKEKWKQPEKICSVAMSNDHTKLATGDSEGNVWLYDIASGKVLWTFATQLTHLEGLAFANDDSVIYAGVCANAWGGGSYGLHTLKTDTGELVCPPFILRLPQSHAISDITTMQNGSLLISLMTTGRLHLIFNPETERIVWRSELLVGGGRGYHKLSTDEQFIYTILNEPYRVVIFKRE